LVGVFSLAGIAESIPYNAYTDLEQSGERAAERVLL
jgi:hypothetical protein